jgi:hypothetical protein
LLTKLDLEKATCRDCRWHEPEPEGNQYGVWCGFYKDTLSLDRIHEMPLRCNQYRHESNADPLPPARTELPVETSILPIPQRPFTKVAIIPPDLRSDLRNQSSDFSEEQGSATMPIQLDLDYWLQQIEALPDETLQVLEEKLKQIAAAIARRKQISQCQECEMPPSIQTEAQTI